MQFFYGGGGLGSVVARGVQLTEERYRFQSPQSNPLGLPGAISEPLRDLYLNPLYSD